MKRQFSNKEEVIRTIPLRSPEARKALDAQWDMLMSLPIEALLAAALVRVGRAGEEANLEDLERAFIWVECLQTAVVTFSLAGIVTALGKDVRPKHDRRATDTPIELVKIDSLEQLLDELRKRGVSL